MKTIQQWLDDYGVSHQNKINKTIHWICVPSIMFSLFGLLLSIPIPGWSFYLNVTTIVFVLAILFYLRLSLPMAIGMAVISLLMYWGVWNLLEYFNWDKSQLAITSVIIFVVAWIGQFIGHKIEGEKPSFFEDLQFLLIGPAWLLHFIYKKIGISY